MSLKVAFASTALSFLALATGQGALIAEYTFDYNSGIDTAGGFDLNFIGSNPSFPGGTYQSDGVSANYLGVTGPGGVPDFTVSLWVNSPVVNQGNFKGIFSNLDNTGAFSWQVDSHSGQYRLVANTAGISENLGTPTAGAWENIVIQKYGGGSYRAYLWHPNC
ncbi:MAG: hypothetical protein KDI11_02915 [Alphaproteobacteria bacterium]|nr:hypothetical protein [Alphaproteobacteria bacterium]